MHYPFVFNLDRVHTKNYSHYYLQATINMFVASSKYS